MCIADESKKNHGAFRAGAANGLPSASIVREILSFRPRGRHRSRRYLSLLLYIHTYLQASQTTIRRNTKEQALA